MNIAKDILYVSKDPERAGGLPCVSGEETLDLLKKVQPGTNVVVFKNNPAIERYCRENGITLLNPPAELSEKIENKITQVAFLGELASLLPKHSIQKVKDITWPAPYILQWAHSHTGEGTLYIEDISEIKNKFPERECRITKYIEGKTFTVNIVVGNTIEVGNISEQITGLAPYTDNRFASVGNDWSVASPKEEITAMALKVGEKMKAVGWKGLFGIDVVFADRLYLIEINARQPASATYESTLQKTNTIFENHIKALLGEPLHKHTVITGGRQIIDRRTMTWIRT
ncbi:MAG: ATP-grasp domain-containing protein [Candidatus Pacebacteria bacterium]|nr:ATP-grasp domain-containing protein [Candidatus Paceibacterota bacterium]